MMNSVDRLFEQVLSDIGTNGLDNSPDWQNNEFEYDETDDWLDNISSDGQEDVYSIDAMLNRDRVSDRVFNRGSPIIGVSPEEHDLIEGNIRHRGFDALAFYKSRRIINDGPFPGKWGIFYLKSGLDYLTSEISLAYPGYSDPRIIAREFLRTHEFVHYTCDLQVLMFEAVLKRNLYLPLHRALKGRRIHFVEEALANKATWNWAKKQKVGIREFAEDFMALQPGAYARFAESKDYLRGEWLANVLDFKPPRCIPRTDIARWVDALPPELLRASLCPEYVIYPNKITDWLSPVFALPPVNQIFEGTEVKKVLNGKYRNFQKKWEHTKERLISNKFRSGLDFKAWKKDGKGSYSVKVVGDQGFRAHLKNQGNGNWLVYDFGNHKELGHGG
jgi:hypothetical protein